MSQKIVCKKKIVNKNKKMKYKNKKIHNKLSEIAKNKLMIVELLYLLFLRNSKYILNYYFNLLYR